MEEILGSEKPGRKRRMLVFVISVLAVMVVGALLVAWNVARQPPADTGSHIIAQGDMTDEQARKLIDDQAEQSRITVSLRPAPELVDGKLHVNFVVPSGNNSFSERLEIEQDGKCVYRSGIVEPAHVIEWCDAPQAHLGDALATVYAVDGSGADFGNPVSVEVKVIEG